MFLEFRKLTMFFLILLGATAMGCADNGEPKRDYSLLSKPDRYVAKGNIDRYGLQPIRVSVDGKSFESSGESSLHGLIGINEEQARDAERSQSYTPEYMTYPGTGTIGWMGAFRLDRDLKSGVSKLKVQVVECFGHLMNFDCDLFTELNITINDTLIQGTGTHQFSSNGPIVWNPSSFKLDPVTGNGTLEANVQEYWNLGRINQDLIFSSMGPNYVLSPAIGSSLVWGQLHDYSYDAYLTEKLSKAELMAIAMIPTLSISHEYLVWQTLENRK